MRQFAKSKGQYGRPLPTTLMTTITHQVNDDLYQKLEHGERRRAVRRATVLHLPAPALDLPLHQGRGELQSTGDTRRAVPRLRLGQGQHIFE